jgi:peptidoglycan/LPS O-acetylase OafA/YrhL
MHVLHLKLGGIGYFVAYVSLVVGLSSLSFRFLEEPLHRWLKKTLASRMAPTEVRREYSQP